MTTRFRQAQATMLAASGVQAESRLLDVPGGTAHALTHGAGPAVLMVNGVGTPAAMWAPLFAQLRGVTVHAVDLPGFGLSDVADPEVADVRERLTGFLLQVLHALELDRPAIIANSLGALATTWLALERPERVSVLVHVGCPALILGTSAPLPMRLLAVRGVGAALAALRPPSVAQVTGMGKMVHEHPLPPELVDLLVETERLPQFARTFRPMLRQLLQLTGARPEVALTAEQLAAVKQPVALIWGNDDPFGSPAVGERAAAALPSAELHVVPGGHVPWVHHAADVAPVVGSFLYKHGVAA